MPSKLPNPAELQIYPKATISEKHANKILSFTGSTRRDHLASDPLTVRFAERARNTEDRVTERILTNQGQRKSEAWTKAEAIASGAQVGPRQPAPAMDSAEPGERLAKTASYLILVPNCPTDQNTDQEIDFLPERLLRAGKAKQRTDAMASYLRRQEDERERATGAKLGNCNTYRVFRHWLETGDARLIAAYCCGQDRLCPVCANLRAGRMASRYENKILSVLCDEPKLTEWLWTFTVKDGDDLAERLNVLRDAMEKMRRQANNFRNGNNRAEWFPFCTVAGGVYSIEIIIGKNSGQWHPHVHVYALCDSEPPRDPDGRCRAMEAWWLDRTGDSFVVDVRPINSAERGNAVIEVLKYTTKFSNMSLWQNLHAWRVLQGARLRSAFGCLYGVPNVKRLTDDLSTDEGAYVDLAFRHNGTEYVPHKLRGATG